MGARWHPATGERVHVAGKGLGHVSDYIASTGRTEVLLDGGETVVVQILRCAKVPDSVPSSAGPNARAEVLQTAEELVNGDRNNQYGDPRQDFQRTAAMWAAYKGVELTDHDVAAMMALLKLSRIAWSPGKQDHWIDLAGYAACGWDCARED